MPVTDEEPDHPLMVEATKTLIDSAAKLTIKYGKGNLEGARAEFIELEKHNRTHWKQRGVLMPELVPIIFNKHNQVYWLRRDLESAGLRGYMLRIIRQRPTITAQDLFKAFIVAYPGLKSILDDSAQEATKELKLQ